MIQRLNKQKVKINFFCFRKYFFCFIFIFTLLYDAIQCFNFKQLGRTQVSRVINQRTSYSFIFYRSVTNSGSPTVWNTQAVPSNANISVQFPTDYILSGNQTCDSLQVTTSTVTLTITSYSCIIQGNRIIFANSLTTLSDYLIRQVRVSYGKILNPSPAIKTKQFTGYLGIDVAVPAGATNVQLQAAVFSNCSLKFGNGGYINSTSPAIFTLIPLNNLNTSSIIRIAFPTYKFWINDISQTLLPITQGSMGCSSVQNVQTSIACSGNYNNFTVQASSLFSSTITSGNRFSFQINSFVSPPTLQPSDSITITSMTNGYQVDKCTVTATQLKPKNFINLQITPVDGSIIVNQKIGLSINMTLSDTINQQDTFIITFPNSLSVTYTNVTTSGSAEGQSSLSGNQLSVAMNTAFDVKYWSSQFFVINFYTVTAPPSIKQSDLITVQILRHNYQKMIGTKTIKATPSTISGTVNPQNLVVANNTVYTFLIRMKDGLSSSGWIQITFPSQISLPTSLSSISVSGIGFKTTPTTSINILQNKLIISQLNGSVANILPQNFSLSVGLIRNPGSTKPTGTFSITSYYATGTQNLVASGTIPGITPSAGIIKSQTISITKNSDIVLANAVQYKIGFVNTYDIPLNGKIKIQIPSDIKIDLSNIQTNCFQQINSTGTKIAAVCSGIFNLTTNKYQITVASVAFTQKLASGSTVTISLQNICTNPDTTRNILGFGIYTYDSQLYLIQSATSGISAKASTPSTCLSVSIDRASKKNSDLTNYTIKFKQSSNLLASSILELTIPNKLQLSANTFCMDMLGTSNLTCTIVSNLVSIKLSNSSVSNMTLVGVLIINVLNTPTFQPLTDLFTLLTKTPDSVNKYCQYTSTSLSLQNNIASNFSSITGTFTPRIYNQITSLIISVKPSSRVIPGYFMVSVATQLNVQTLSCSYQGIVSGSCVQISKNNIKVAGNFTSNLMQFTISGLRAPKFTQNTSQYTSVSSFSSNNFKIDESINLISFSILCNLPCKTCSNTNTSECLSCYHDSNISTQFYYSNDFKFCFSVCPDGYYANQNTSQCQKCGSICKTCSIIASNCSSCFINSTSAPYLSTNSTGGTCSNLCPNTYYPNSLGVCVKCDSPCKQCSNKTSCISCLSGFFMYNGTCQNNCPLTITISNNVSNTCDKCSNVCATCSILISNCTSCSQNAAYYNQTCVAVCPPPLVIKNGICSTCDSICKQCSIKSNNCTKCDTNSNLAYLYNYTCLINCPQTYYKDLINGLCQLCETLNIGCKNCSTMSTCLSCDPGYIFLNNKCYNSTPFGYYNDNGVAKPCTGDCASCVNYSTKCTSCLTKNLDGNDCVPTCPATKVAQNKTCIPCQSPCLTCSNIKTNCTSCIPSLVPDVYLNNFYCTQICPDYTYGNQTTNLCVQCKTPCLKCIGDTQCLSCINGKFLMGIQCLDNCTPGYIGINKTCSQCTPPCLTCQIQKTRCLSCQASYFLYNSSAPTCILNCSSVGLYPNLQTQICTGCQAPCATCINTSNTCLTCNNNSLVFYQNKCLQSCPESFYSLSGNCMSCPTQCRTCTSLLICQTCKFNFYLHLNFCIDKCPSLYPVITSSGSCAKCSEVSCKTCSQNDYCQLCQLPYYLHFGKCVEHCPINYLQNVNNITGIQQCLLDPAANITQNTINSTLKSGGNLFPVPFTIAAAFFGIATIMSKFQNPNTFVSGVLYSLLSVLQWGSVGVVELLFYSQYGFQKIEFYIIGGSFAFLYLLNFLAFLIQNIYLMGDESFSRWKNLGSNKCFYYISSLIGLLATHKFKNLIYCKMFNFVFLKARLDSVQKFRIFNIFSFLSFLSSGGVLFGLGLIYSSYTIVVDQTLMAYLDATILTIINIILAILNSRKNDDFFEQKTEEGYVVHKRIQDNDELLYGQCIPMATEQKFDFNHKTHGKLVTDFKTRYRRIQSQLSQQSVRNISIQAQPILGEQSRITHLNSSQISDLNLFQQKQVSVQYNQPPPEVEDKSINISFKQNHEISIQMDHLSQNQISVQVQRQNHEISIQYAPNLMDQDVGMSRQIAQISVQYSAKPIFINIDQSYRSDDNNDDLDEASRLQDKQNSQDRNKSSQSCSSESSCSSISERGIKKPDQKLKQQLELDINERLRMRQQQLYRLQQQKRKQQVLRAVANFQKKKNHQDQFQQTKNRNNNKYQMPRNQLDKIFNNQQTIKNDNTQSLMDSKYDLIKKEKQFSSNQSRIVTKGQNQNHQKDNSFQGQKTEEYIIQMLSGQKTSTNQNQQNSNKFQINNNILQNEMNPFQKKQKIIKVQGQNQLEDSNQISLNMTDQMQQIDKIKLNKMRPNPKFNFQNKNQSYQSASQQYEDQQKNQRSQQYTKSISTKLISTQKWKPPLPKGLQRQLIDSSQDIQNSYYQENNLTKDIINGPIQPSFNNNRVNYMKSRYFDQLNDHQNEPQQHARKTNIADLLRQNKSRNLKSATLMRNQNSKLQNRNQDSDQYELQQFENQQKQQPLPPPQQTQDPQLEQLQFQQNQKVLISPLDSQQNHLKINEGKNKLNQSKNLPQGLGIKNMRFRTNSNKKLSAHKSQTLNNIKKDTKSFSKSRDKLPRQKPIHQQILNPTSSIKLKFPQRQKNNKSIQYINKQLQKQERKLQNRKKNYELMLDRPNQFKKNYGKQQNQLQRQRKNSVQKIYLNKPNNF